MCDVREVVEALRPVIREELSREVGVLVSIARISAYLGIHRHTLMNWYRNYGFPLSKSPDGKWTVTRNLVDRWFHNRHMMMVKAKEMGFRTNDVWEARSFGKRMANLPPESLTDSERAQVVAAITEDRAEDALFNKLGIKG